MGTHGGVFTGYCNTYQNTASFGGVLSGDNNIVTGGVSVITGGRHQTSSGDYNAILGGGYNNDCGFSHVAIFGQNVNAVANNTFHVECLNAANTPNVAAGPFPTGTIFWKAGNLLGPGDKVLVLQ